MALVLEDGTGKTGTTVVYADAAYWVTYWAARIQREALADLDSEIVESLLLYATRDIDYGYNWKGIKATAEQAREWPRYGATDRNGWAIDEDAIPEALKEATCERAAELYDNDALDESASYDQVLQELSVGKGAVSLKWESGTYQEGSNPRVDLLLSGLYVGGATISEIVRA